MARYLRDISIRVSPLQKLPEGFTQKDFNVTTHTVQDIFLYLIPNRFEFDNILKLIIDINSGEKPLKNKINFDGYVQYSLNNFDFDEYFKLTKVQQNEVILNVLSDTISQIPNVSVENQKIAFDIIKKIKESNFEYTFISKLSKQQRSKKHKAIVEIQINDDGQNSFLKIENNSQEEILKLHLIKNIVYEFYNNLYKSKWEGNNFQIIDRNGEIFRQVYVNDEDNTR
jgi:hypothetical protein